MVIRREEWEGGVDWEFRIDVHTAVFKIDKQQGLRVKEKINLKKKKTFNHCMLKENKAESKTICE